MLKLIIFTAVAVCASGRRVRRHETDTGECPTFPPMQGFDYDRVREITYKDYCHCVMYVADTKSTSKTAKKIKSLE